MNVLIFSFGMYAAVIILISYFFHTRQETMKSFALGNRSLNFVATALATHSSDMSIWLLMGFPGTVYLHGVPMLWIPIGLLAGMYMSWTYVAGQLRASTERLQNITLPSYFATHFEDTSGIIRLISTIFTLIFFLFYIASGLVGIGTMFENVFGIDYHLGIAYALCITIFYTFMGGFVGVAWCDVFQSLFLLIAITIVPLYAFNQFFSNQSLDIIAQLKHIPLSLLPKPFGYNLANSLILACSWGLGYFGQPHILVNFMGMDDKKSVFKARNVGLVWQAMVMGAAFCIGLIGIAYFTHSLTDPELVFVEMTRALFSPLFAGTILCAIIAAGLTTIDTQILVAASTITHEWYKRFINPSASAKQMVKISRCAVLCIPMLSYLIAFNKNASVFGLIEYAWTGFGATFGPIILASLYSKKITSHGVIFGMLTAGTITLIWPCYIATISAMIPAFLINTLILMVTTR